jgi:hypothetical protein
MNIFPNLFSVRYFTLSLAFVFLGTRYARAYDLEDTAAPVIKRSSHPSGTKFKADESWRTRITGFGVSKDQVDQLSSDMQNKMDWRVARYDTFEKELPAGAGTYDVLPTCKDSQVTHTEVLVDSEKLAWFDLLFYDYHDTAQTKRAENWDLPTAPFLEGDYYNPYREGDRQQDMARLFEIRCLPTRFHFVNINGTKYLEYREGERAWDKEGQ